MDQISREIYYIQNPAIGGAILWRFCCGYYSVNCAPIPFPLLFIVLPMILREDIRYFIKHTNKSSGLSKISEKAFKEKRTDSIYSLNDAAIEMRILSLESFNVGTASNLMKLDFQTAMVYPLVMKMKSGCSSDTKDILNSAEKLGYWCSELSLHEIGKWLKVRF